MSCPTSCVSASWPCTAFTRNRSLICILLKSPVRSWTVTSVTRPTSLSGVSVGVSPSSCLLNISGASKLYHTFAFHLSLILRAAARDFFSAMQTARRGGRYLRVRERAVAGGRSADPTGEPISPASASQVRGGPSSQATNRVLVRPDLRARALDRCPRADRPARRDRRRLVARPRGFRLRVHRAHRGLGPVHGQHHLLDNRDSRSLAPEHSDVVPGRHRTVPLQPSLRFAECSAGRPGARESRVRGIRGRLVGSDGSPGEFEHLASQSPSIPPGSDIASSFLRYRNIHLLVAGVFLISLLPNLESVRTLVWYVPLGILGAWRWLVVVLERRQSSTRTHDLSPMPRNR